MTLRELLQSVVEAETNEERFALVRDNEDIIIASESNDSSGEDWEGKYNTLLAQYKERFFAPAEKKEEKPEEKKEEKPEEKKEENVIDKMVKEKGGN
jgi:hypothetical protein